MRGLDTTNRMSTGGDASIFDLGLNIEFLDIFGRRGTQKLDQIKEEEDVSEKSSTMHRDKNQHADFDLLKTGNSGFKHDLGPKIYTGKDKQERRKFSDLTDYQKYQRESQEVSVGAGG
jgi:hypothetical protein